MELPTFREIAQQRIDDAGPRDKTINIKVAIGTARMMVAAEDAAILAICNVALPWVALATSDGDPGRNPQSSENAKSDLAIIQAAIAKANVAGAAVQ